MTLTEALWANPAVLGWLFDRGLTEQTIDRAQLGFNEEKNAISIPYFDAAGRQTMIRYRNLAPNAHHKYEPEKVGMGNHLYQVKNVEGVRVYLTEGEFDALILGQLGLRAVGVPGAENFKKPWRWLFRDADEVVIVFDGDDAGRKGANKVASWLHQITEARAVELPEKEDVSSLYVNDPTLLGRLL